jgi:ceramide glucosyltransferase
MGFWLDASYVIGVLIFASVAIWWRRLRRARVTAIRSTRPLRWPSITVVRPVRGRDVGALDNFRAALDTGYPGEVETLFVFDDDRDPGLPLARLAVDEHRAARRRGRAEVIVAGARPPTRTGKLHAMVVGAERARGVLIAFGDSDTRPDRRVLPALVEKLITTPGAGSAFAPLSVHRSARGVGDVLYALMQNALYAPFAAHAAGPRGALPFIMGQLMVFTREALIAVGGPACAEGQLVDDMYIGRCVHRRGFLNLLVQQPLHVETGGLTLRAFLPIYRRWIQFSRNGLPLSFTWRQMLLGAETFFAVAAVILGALSAHWLLALVGAVVVAAIMTMLFDLNRRYGGAPVPLRYVWAPIAFFLLSPIVLLSIARRRNVEWRGRVYALDRKAALAA